VCVKKEREREVVCDDGDVLLQRLEEVRAYRSVHELHVVYDLVVSVVYAHIVQEGTHAANTTRQS